MSEAAGISLLGAAAIGCVLLHFALSVALASAARLSRVALQHLGNEFGDRLAFVQRLAESTSPHRLAAELMRQWALLGFVLFGALFAAGAEIALPWHVAVLVAALGGVLVGEQVLARGIADWNPRRALRATAWLLRSLRWVLFPLVAALATWLAWWDRNGRSDELREEAQEEEVEALIEVGEREGLLEAEESRMVRGIVDLDETVVRELMTPRTEIVALDAETSVRAARRLILEAGHSRLPVYRDSIDNMVGLLHSRDLFRAWDAGDEGRSVEHYLRPVPFVPEALSAAELLGEMRQRTHMAVVVDEYGGVAGLVTLEDLLEEIVGEIRDEHEEEEEVSLRAEGSGSWIVNAVVHVKEIEQIFDIDFEDREFDTVGGMVVASFGRVPSVGDRCVAHGLEVEVLEADRRRVQRVRLRPASAASESRA